MPDWSYQTLIRPLLEHTTPARAHGLTLAALRRLGAHQLGPALIALLGHTAPAPSLARTALGLHFATPVLVGAELGGNERALPALARFGVGGVEVGPAARAAPSPALQLARVAATAAIRLAGPPAVPVDRLAAQLAQVGDLSVHVTARLAHHPDASATEAAAERAALIEQLAPYVVGFTLESPPPTWGGAAWEWHLQTVAAAAHVRGRRLLVGVPADATADELSQIITPALASGVDGVVVFGWLRGADGARLLGDAAHAPTLATVRAVRARWGPALPVVAGSCAAEPAAALALLDAGADLVQLDVGPAFGSPGLPKRVNEAIRARTDPPPAAERPARLAGWLTVSWLWLLLLGLGMLAGGALAWLVAVTTVVLPYDLAFVGASRAELAALNPRLLPYMAHNRVALAGTMVSIGVLYTQLALHGVRFGVRWAHTAICVSAAVGFLSFFLFLGYGYVDPLHAYVSLALLPLFILGLRARADAPPVVPAPDLRNDRAWCLAQWGQLGAVALSVGLVGAGVTIAGVGVTAVFVPEDLAFLCTTPEALMAANGRLTALVAHDRAGLGGALVANGLAVLLLALWGVRHGAGWVWWTLLLAGAPGFAGALGVHVAVGYLDGWHLAPGLLGLALFLTTLALLRPYLVTRRPAV